MSPRKPETAAIDENANVIKTDYKNSVKESPPDEAEPDRIRSSIEELIAKERNRRVARLRARAGLSTADAEDIVHNAAVRLLTSPPRYFQPGILQYTIIRYAFNDHFREVARQAGRPRPRKENEDEAVVQHDGNEPVTEIRNVKRPRLPTAEPKERRVGSPEDVVDQRFAAHADAFRLFEGLKNADPETKHYVHQIVGERLFELSAAVDDRIDTILAGVVIANALGANLRQDDIAALAGVDRSTVSRRMAPLESIFCRPAEDDLNERPRSSTELARNARCQARCRRPGPSRIRHPRGGRRRQ
jgi:DNA-directed RNA polymerase specialized sigma24 family protein